MPPWLFNVFLNCVVTKMNRLGNEAGLKLAEEICWVSVVPFTEDAVLFCFIMEFEREFRNKSLKINHNKRKVMWMRNREGERLEWDGVKIKGANLKKDKTFKHLEESFNASWVV